MSGRVAKSRSRKVDERSLLALYVSDLGAETMPCSRCFRLSIPCKVSDQSSRCAGCIAAARPCDGSSVASFRKGSFLRFSEFCVFSDFLYSVQEYARAKENCKRRARGRGGP